MTTAPDLIVLGAGGHARVVIDILHRSGRAIAGLTDIDTRLHGGLLDDAPVLGGDEVVLKRQPKSIVLVNALGGQARMGDSGLALRRRLYEDFKNKGYAFEQVVSPDAVIAHHVVLNEGCHVITGAIVHPGSTIGINAIVNTGAQIDHDCVVGPHSHIAPGAVLCGGISVGAGCLVGAGAVVIEGVKIGDGAVIGAGAVVVADVAAGATVLGNPARVRASLK